MKTYIFDAFEFEPIDSEQEVEVRISTTADIQHPTVARFADNVVGEGGSRRLGVPTPFSGLPTFSQDRALLKQVADVRIDNSCAWPCFIVEDEWNKRHLILDAGNAFISFRWSTSA